jgi:hypothetical protein
MFLVMAGILVAVLCAAAIAQLSGRASVDSRFFIRFGLVVMGVVVLVLQIRKARRRR